MIVANQLAFLAAFTFQRFMMVMLNDPSANRAFSPDGSLMAVSVPSRPGVSLLFSGSGLGEDEGGGLTGQITNFQIVDNNSLKALNGLLPLAVLAAALIAAAQDGEGEFNPGNYPGFYELLMPAALLFQLLYTGGPKGEMVEGFSGPDEISTGRGNDTLILGSGADKFNGGLGLHDLVTGAEQPGGIRIDLGLGFARTGDGSRVRLRNIEDANGSEFRDWIFGNEGDNRLNGLGGRDDIFGGGGNDTINGGRGNDDIDGGPGDDTLTGGRGFDDFFVYPDEGDDVITDFTGGVDALDLVEFGFASLEEVLSFAEDTPAGVVFTFAGGGSLLVEGTTIAQISDDIIF